MEKCKDLSIKTDVNTKTPKRTFKKNCSKPGVLEIGQESVPLNTEDAALHLSNSFHQTPTD